VHGFDARLRRLGRISAEEWRLCSLCLGPHHGGWRLAETHRRPRPALEACAAAGAPCRASSHHHLRRPELCHACACQEIAPPGVLRAGLLGNAGCIAGLCWLRLAVSLPSVSVMGVQKENGGMMRGGGEPAYIQTDIQTYRPAGQRPVEPNPHPLSRNLRCLHGVPESAHHIMCVHVWSECFSWSSPAVGMRG